MVSLPQTYLSNTKQAPQLAGTSQQQFGLLIVFVMSVYGQSQFNSLIVIISDHTYET